MAKRFVFLEIFDPELIALIGWLREAAMGTSARHQVHVTIRGPYSSEIPRAQIERYKNVLKSDPLVLDGVGSFSNDDWNAVYLRVQHPRLRQIWWKPDFPVLKYGFNPHITIYEGKDSVRAAAALDFLKKEKLRLMTWKFDVTARASDHSDIFSEAKVSNDHFLSLVNKGLVRADVVSRFQRALNRASKAA